MTTFYDPGRLPGWPTGGLAETRSGEPSTPRTPARAQARVRSLRDAAQDAATLLGSAESVLLRELHDGLWAACEAIVGDDLGPDGALIGQQFEAFFERLRELVAAHTEPVPVGSLGLPGDARFLHDMAEYLTRRYALDEEE